MASAFKGDTSGVSFDVLQPQLYADVIMEPLTLPKSLTFNYLGYDLDKCLLSSGSSDGVYNTKARINGFNGKFVTKLLLMTIKPEQLLAVGAEDAVKCDGSLELLNERIQLNVNGSALFDFNGIENNDARKMGILSDAWGVLNVPILSFLHPYPDSYVLDDVQQIDAKPYLQSPAVQNLNGRLSYGGCMVNSRISDLQLEHTRTENDLITPTMIYLYGEVVKSMVISNGNYVIVNQ
jgi:hypothetical protein